jgi:hypothetical protein
LLSSHKNDFYATKKSISSASFKKLKAKESSSFFGDTSQRTIHKFSSVESAESTRLNDNILNADIDTTNLDDLVNKKSVQQVKFLVNVNGSIDNMLENRTIEENQL